MAFTAPTVRRRILITGETGSGKTHSLRSFPSPKVVLVCPGEKGQDTLLKSDGTPLDANTKVIVWENDPAKPLTSSQIIEEVRQQLFTLVKDATIQTLAIDGFHKLYEYVLDAKSGGEYFAGSPFKTESRIDSQVVDPRVPSQAEHWMADTLSIAALSRIPYVVVTVWDKDGATRRAKTIDGKKEKWQDIPTFKLPALYSQASKKLLGEFGISVHATCTEKRIEEGGKWVTRRLYRWQTQPDSEVGACAIKMDGAVVRTIPKFVAADWNELKKYVE